MIKALIVDDEGNARETLKMLVEQHTSNVEILGLADSAASAYKMINELKPELVFPGC